MTVRFRPIAGYAGYRVGTDGSVWSARVRKGIGKGGSIAVIGRKWKRLNPSKTEFGHLYVTLSKLGGKQKFLLVHRLALEAFVGPCPERMECRHLNGVPWDNQIENLVWGTGKENGEDKAKHNTGKGERNGRAKLVREDVRAIRLLWDTGQYTKRRLGVLYGVSDVLIFRIISRKAWGWLE